MANDGGRLEGLLGREDVARTAAKVA